MPQQPDPGGPGREDQQAERWLAALRTGAPAERAAARRGLAALFERRGLMAEAIDLLVANVREGHRDVASFQALARLYRAQGDEYLSASAALEATRLGGRTQPGPREPEPAPWQQVGEDRRSAEIRQRAASAYQRAGGTGARPSGQRSAGPGPGHSSHRAETEAQPGTAPGPGATHTPGADPGAAWRRPLRLLGWLAFVGTAIGALAVSSGSVISAVLYLVAATLLAVLMSGWRGGRHLLRLPIGPLGDGALLFGWLLLVLAAGTILPRGPGSVADVPSSPPATSTPGLYRTPVVTPAPALSTVATPSLTTVGTPSPAPLTRR
jgi:hypothetical protein